MRIKFTTSTGGTDYLSVRDFKIARYGNWEAGEPTAHDFWYFSSGTWFSYSGYDYKFAAKADIEKMVDNIYYSEDQFTIYDFDTWLDRLNITKNPETGLYEMH